MKDIELRNIEIAKFMGGVITPSNGYRGSVMRFPVETHYLHCHPFPSLKYHSSWDWQVPAWSKISHLTKSAAADSQVAYNWHIRFVSRYETAVFKNNPLAGFEAIAEAIQWYNSQQQ